MKRILVGMLSIFVLVSLVPTVSAVEAYFYLMEVSPQQVKPGETTTLNITLKNLAPNYASYLKASLDADDTSPIDPIGVTQRYITKKAVGAMGSEEYFGVVHQGEEITVSFPIYTKLNTAEDVYNVPLLLSWKNNLLEDVSQTVYISVLVMGDISLGIASVSTDPVKIRSGDDNVKITLSVENSGEATAENIEAELLLKDPFKPSYSQSDKAYIGRLDSSGTQSAMFYIDIAETAEPGKYSISLKLTYEDTRNNGYEVEKNINFLVEPKPYFEVTRTTLEPEKPKAGEHALLYIDVKNIGFEKGESVDLRVVREAGQPFTFDVRSDFIGTLKPGETGTAALEFDVDKDAIPKEYLLKLTVRCTGDTEKGDTNVYTQELKAPVDVEAGGPRQSQNIKYVAVILSVLVVIGLASKLRKPSKQG